IFPVGSPLWQGSLAWASPLALFFFVEQMLAKKGSSHSEVCSYLGVDIFAFEDAEVIMIHDNRESWSTILE
ncbi:hypothetical protein BGX38DRAFT_1230244, partial [Terfezia claveryi]